MNIAIILAGGVGSRVGLSTPKQFFKVAGKTVIEHTLDAFQQNPHIHEICIVSHPAHIAQVEDIVLRGGWTKVKKILRGGAQRSDSSLAAIRAYSAPGATPAPPEGINLVFHDAVRPLVSQRIISDVCQALAQGQQAVDTVVPATDTIIEAAPGPDAAGQREVIAAIPPRALLRRGQTPQAFRLEVIAEAYRRALLDEDLRVTDDCGVVVRYMPEVPVSLVRGEESNMKLTYKEDTFLLDKLFQLRSVQATALPAAQHDRLRGAVAAVLGGSYGIGADTATLLRSLGAKVHTFSRSQTGTDVARRESVRQALRSVREQEGRLDYVVCTAGLLNREPLTSMEPEVIARAINTNYLGTVNVALEAYPLLRESRGSLVFFTSSSYTRGRALYSIYSSTKAAIVNFVQAIAQEWESDGLRVNCINPERTLTPMRVSNFGVEPPETLLRSEQVAQATVQTLLSPYTGQVVDVRRQTL